MADSIAGVLFDLDGTLVRSPIDFAGMKRAVRELAVRHGVEALLHAKDVLGLVEEAARALDARSSAPPRAREAFVAACEDAIVAVELEAVREAAAFEGAIETLAWLTARVRVGIVTRNSRVVVDRLLTTIALPHHVLVTRNEAPRPKPDPSHLLHALAHLGVAPHESVMVGDHAMDIAGGRAAGMRAVGIAHEALDALNANGVAAFAGSDPDHIVTSFAQLRSWLEPALRNP